MAGDSCEVAHPDPLEDGEHCVTNENDFHLHLKVIFNKTVLLYNRCREETPEEHQSQLRSGSLDMMLLFAQNLGDSDREYGGVR